MTKSKKLRGERKQTETMLVVDESSGVDEKLYDVPNIWVDRMLFFGSPWPRKNFFLRERIND